VSPGTTEAALEEFRTASVEMSGSPRLS